MIATIVNMKPDREHDILHVTFSLNGEKREDVINEHTRLIPLWFDKTLHPLPESEMQIITCSPEGEQKSYWIAGKDISKFLSALHSALHEEDA